MNLQKLFAAALCLSSLTVASAQIALAPKPGSAAPALTFDHLLQAPAGAKADLPSLHGKAVVLEFWATWCVPCINQIPTFNALQASVDPAKVQFISVDDEDPAKVEKFLQHKQIAGWLGFDTTGKTLERYHADSRPITIVIDPRGRVVSNSMLNDVRPEDLTREQLMAVAAGKPVTFTKKHPKTDQPQKMLRIPEKLGVS